MLPRGAHGNRRGQFGGNPYTPVLMHGNARVRTS